MGSKVIVMKLFRNKVWRWYDIGLLKWCCILLGMIAGAYFADFVKGNIVWFVLLAIILAIRPAIAYWND